MPIFTSAAKTAIAFFAFATAATAALAQPVERKEISTLTAGQVESLRRGVAKMKARDSEPRNSADFRRSWEFWSNNHAHFGPSCTDSLPVTLPGMKGQKRISPVNEVERNAWCACRHDSIHFLAWHRVYLHFFERVLREASGDPSLTLPFWDYGAPDHRKLPQAFAEESYIPAGTSASASNPLYSPHRNSVLLGGGSVLPVVVDYTATMAATTFTASNGTGFTELIDQAPHGAMHCYLAANGSCPNGLMGSFETAAKDPVFWLHHANIDRLTQCWMQKNAGTNDFVRKPELLKVVYRFVDETGQVNKKPVREILDLAQLNYSYAAGSGCEGGPPIVATSEKKTPVNKEVARARLAGRTTFSTDRAVSLPAKSVSNPVTASSSAATRRTYLLLQDVEERGDASLYEVSLLLPSGETVPVSVLSFFGATGGKVHRHSPVVRAIDITPLTEKLGAPGVIPANTSIQITPLRGDGTGVPSTASSRQPTISVGRIDLLLTE